MSLKKKNLTRNTWIHRAHTHINREREWFITLVQTGKVTARPNGRET